MHEPDRGGGAGQRVQQLHHPVRGNELHHHQIHREGLQVRPVPDRTGPGALGAGRGVHNAAAAQHLMLVVLGDPHRDLRDLVLLVAVHDPQIRRPGQLRAAPAPPLREPVQLFGRVVGPGQMRPRRPGLLAPLAPRPGPAFRLHRRCLARIVVARGRHRRVRAVAREQMLEPGQPRRGFLVGRSQFGDPRVLLGDPRRLLADERDQLLTRHLLGRGHFQITPAPPPTSPATRRNHISHISTSSHRRSGAITPPMSTRPPEPPRRSASSRPEYSGPRQGHAPRADDATGSHHAHETAECLRWKDYPFSQETDPDWFYASGAVENSASGVVTVHPPVTPGGEPRVTVDYQT